MQTFREAHSVSLIRNRTKTTAQNLINPSVRGAGHNYFFLNISLLPDERLTLYFCEGKIEKRRIKTW